MSDRGARISAGVSVSFSNMPVKIDQVTSEVVSEPEPLGATRDQAMEWQELDRMRQLMARHRQDQLRTAAEGFDD